MEQITREMGCTRAEFEHWLPGATRQAPTESKGNRHRIQVGAGTVEIILNPMPPRRIASISIPVLSVIFRFEGIEPGERQAFLDFFDHYTRRGGG